jgi:hypothetical protein
MTSTKEQRFKRLADVRKHQRDEVTAAVQKARSVRDERDAEHKRAAAEAAQEARASEVRPLEPFDPEARRLQLDCLLAAANDAAEKEAQLKEAEGLLSGETKRLFSAHAKVRQMELLATAQRQADIGKADKAEQKTSDDLALIKEADK